jgi:hypothetical protein
MCVPLYACTRGYVRLCVCVSLCVYVCVCVGIDTYECIYTHIQHGAPGRRRKGCRLCVCLCVCVCVYMCMCVYVYMHTCRPRQKGCAECNSRARYLRQRAFSSIFLLQYKKRAKQLSFEKKRKQENRCLSSGAGRSVFVATAASLHFFLVFNFIVAAAASCIKGGGTNLPHLLTF